jgi:hypothetical protein
LRRPSPQKPIKDNAAFVNRVDGASGYIAFQGRPLTGKEQELNDGTYQGTHRAYRGVDGHLHVKDISSYWLPDIKLTRKIGGTIYTVSGSYEGTETLDRKLRRILLAQGMEGIHDN